MTTTIVILANSIKHKQHCVAGKLVKNGQWVRLVSDECGAELSHELAKCSNPHGRFGVKPLQKVMLQLLQHVPLLHQPENYISENNWIQNYRIERDQLAIYEDKPETLWGFGDRIDGVDVRSGLIVIEQSLYLVKVLDIRFIRVSEKRRILFSFNEIEYDLSSTDPNFEKFELGEMQHTNYLCISLGEEYRGCHFKIIATIL